MAEEGSVGGGRLAAVAAMPAMAADMAVDGGGDEIAGTKVAHLRSQPVDRAGNLVAQDHRHLDAAPEGAVAHHDVLEAHTAGNDRDPELARPRLARPPRRNAPGPP